MIRKLKLVDMDKVMCIWLNSNIEAHSFISEKYWRNNFEMVKQVLPKAEVYVYEDELNGEVQGFIGLEDMYIAGIFVCSERRSQGIGKKLLEHAKSVKSDLSLNVYEKNEKAVRFYLREDFRVKSKEIDKNTGENEYYMIWS